MTSVADLVSDTVNELNGWGGVDDRFTFLNAPITDPAAMTFTVTDAVGAAMGISPGVVEIGDEQMFVRSVDINNKTVTLAARGLNGTTPATHASGVKVTSEPSFTRKAVLDRINEALGATSGQLFVPKFWTGTVTSPSNTYSLVTDPDADPWPNKIIDCQWQDFVGNWYRVRSYTLDPFDGTFRIGGGILGRPLRVVYSTDPLTLSLGGDFSDSGLPDTCSDVIRLGATGKMLLGLDISKMQIDSVEQSDRTKLVPVGSAAKAAQFVMAEYQQRLNSEAANLRRRFKARMVFSF